MSAKPPDGSNGGSFTISVPTAAWELYPRARTFDDLKRRAKPSITSVAYTAFDGSLTGHRDPDGNRDRYGNDAPTAVNDDTGATAENTDADGGRRRYWHHLWHDHD